MHVNACAADAGAPTHLAELKAVCMCACVYLNVCVYVFVRLNVCMYVCLR